MAPEEDRHQCRRCNEEVRKQASTAPGSERGAARENETLARKIFELVLALTTEPSKLAQARQMLVQFQEQSDLPETFSRRAMRQLDARVRSMALEYAHDAKILVQLLSFQGGTLDGLLQTIEDLYQHEQISQRVYVKAKLLLRTAGQQKAPN